MAISPDLVEFVKESLGRGIARSDIEDALTGAGWPREAEADPET